MIPRILRHECGNCRYRYAGATVDGALYQTCHQGPPFMLAEPNGTLRTWFPIVQDIMHCAQFRYRWLIVAGMALAIGVAGVVGFYALRYAGVVA